MRWITITATILSLLGIAFSTIRNIQFLGLALIILVVYFDLEQSINNNKK